MKTFYLKTKNSEDIIKKGNLHSKELAIEFFAAVKQISMGKLLDIFRVTTK